ncbi:hypothetical protein LH612_37710, partial [Klebsiella pneumoniae]|nr:hypothetical protein [Klebsiella pneumoniae]
VDVGTQEELLERCELFRALLAGSGESIDRRFVPEASDRQGGTAGVWPEPEPEDPVAAGPAAAVPGKHGISKASMPPTPELLEGVRSLPPATDQPRRGPVDPTADDPDFRLSKLFGSIRWG